MRDAGVDHGALRADHDRLQNMGREYADLAVEGGLAAAGALPPPFGTVADAASLGRSLWRGDWGGALMDAVGFIPIVGDGAKAGRLANRLNDLRRSLDTLNTGVARGLNRTRDAARAHWNRIRRQNSQAYRDALARCNNTQACKDAAALEKGPQYRNTPTSNTGTWDPPEGRGDGVFTPNNGGPPITYRNGFPDYSGHVHAQNVGGVRVPSAVDIPMTGRNRTDFALADEAMRSRVPGWERPDGHTWHHHEDGVTMQLVPRNIHATGDGAATPHMGGASLYRGSQQEAF
ncbi:HNH endonuclease [Jannaschia sp. LMIT008]|uniref:HNH endonuclease n=1 Tax=Jannaschia maritima TaxID=3032585 RepID=UPI0028124737|nr:HNH endonuclease [Jannaschia sp. LMIT008]